MLLMNDDDDDDDDDDSCHTNVKRATIWVTLRGI